MRIKLSRSTLVTAVGTQGDAYHVLADDPCQQPASESTSTSTAAASTKLYNWRKA